MTAPRPQGRAELEHPSWCQAELCSLETIAAGGCHQREYVVVDDAGRRVASVLLREYARGRATISTGSWMMREWSPREAERVAQAMLEVKRVFDAAERVA